MKIFKLSTLLLLCSCGVSNIENEIKEKSVLSSFEIKYIEPEMKKPEINMILSGKVTINPEKSVNYLSLIDGQIINSNFKLGQYVNKDDVMFEIRSTELNSLYSEIKVAERNLKSAEVKYNNKLINETEFIQAEMDVKRIKSDISLLGENNHNGTFNIKSPGSGYVIQKNGVSGTTFTCGENLFIISDLSIVRVEANIYACDLRHIKKGQKVYISTTAYPEITFEGEITMLSPVFDSEDKTLKAYIDIANEDLLLKPDMSVRVSVSSVETKEMVTIPSEVIIFDNDKYFVVTNNSEPQIKEINIKQKNKDYSYIISGINIGDKIVYENQLLIYNELKGK